MCWVVARISYVHKVLDDISTCYWSQFPFDKTLPTSYTEAWHESPWHVNGWVKTMYPCSSLENTWEWMFIPPNLVGQRLVFTHPQASVVLKRPCFGPKRRRFRWPWKFFPRRSVRCRSRYFYNRECWFQKWTWIGIWILFFVLDTVYSFTFGVKRYIYILTHLRVRHMICRIICTIK